MIKNLLYKLTDSQFKVVRDTAKKILKRMAARVK